MPAGEAIAKKPGRWEPFDELPVRHAEARLELLPMHIRGVIFNNILYEKLSSPLAAHQRVGHRFALMLQFALEFVLPK